MIQPIALEHFRAAIAAVLAAPIAVPAAAHTNDALLMVAQFISQVKINGFSAAAIEKMKKSKTPIFSWISTKTPWVTRLVALGAATGTHLGLHWTFTGSTLVVTGLSFTAIMMLLYNIAENYLCQHAWWKVAFANGTPSETTSVIPIKVPPPTATPTPA